VLMYSLDGDLADILIGGVRVPAGRPAVCVVLAAEGYPEKPRTGDMIGGIDGAEATGATVFHGGTKREGSDLFTNGGRVLGVTASGETLPVAVENAYRAAVNIHFDGVHYRKDIGQKGLKRWYTAGRAGT
jgi:phosphoribosylamine---glycine ligase